MIVSGSFHIESSGTSDLDCVLFRSDYDAATITQRVTEKVGPGSIVLFHNAALHTPEALPGILEYLLGQGYSIVPVSQLVLSGEEGTDYTIDHTGRQCPLP